jgi:hypothetical protein
MFSRIQTRHFRSLKAVDQSLGPVQALVGPNASGKTTFLDVIVFLGELVRRRGDVGQTAQVRSANFEKLIWQGGNGERDERTSFQLVLEAPIPDAIRSRMAPDKQGLGLVRYEVGIGLDRTANEVGLNHETLWLGPRETKILPRQRLLFPELIAAAPEVLFGKSKPGYQTVMKKTPGGNDNYYPEGSRTYRPSFRLGRTKQALAHIPADTDALAEQGGRRRAQGRGAREDVGGAHATCAGRPLPAGAATQARASSFDAGRLRAERA